MPVCGFWMKNRDYIGISMPLKKSHLTKESVQNFRRYLQGRIEYSCCVAK